MLKQIIKFSTASKNLQGLKIAKVEFFSSGLSFVIIKRM